MRLKRDEAAVPAVRSAIEILHQVAALGRARGFEIADALDINRSTCHGILKTLVAGGLLDFQPAAKQYALGPTLIALGARAFDAGAYVSVARPFLEDWVSANHMTILLAQLLPQREFIVVDKVDSSHVIKVTVAVGQRFPLVVPAMGRAQLAWMPESEACHLIQSTQIEQLDREADFDLNAFLAALPEVRERGWSSSRHEYYRTANAVAAPVFAPDGSVAFIICSLGADADLPADRFTYFGNAIRRCADGIGDELAARVGVARAVS